MADLIQAIFVTPGLAFARLGGSSTPLSAYDWVDTRAPRADGGNHHRTGLVAGVQPDGSPQPFMAGLGWISDGDLIRPSPRSMRYGHALETRVSAPETWRDIPLTPAFAAGQQRPGAGRPADEGHGAKSEGRAADGKPGSCLRHVSAFDPQCRRQFACCNSRHKSAVGLDADDTRGAALPWAAYNSCEAHHSPTARSGRARST